jgi:hypothetical protein
MPYAYMYPYVIVNDDLSEFWLPSKKSNISVNNCVLVVQC